MKRAKNFYPIDTIFKTDDLCALPDEYIKRIKDYQDVKQAYLPDG